MKIRSSSTLLIAAFIVALFAPSLSIAQCGDFYDGFESGSLGPQWILGTGNYTRAVTNTSAAVGNFSLSHASTVSNSFYQGTYATWSPSQPTYISFWMRTNTTTAANGYVVVGNSNIATDNGILFCYFNSTSGLRFFNSTGYNHPIVANQWYHVEARNINWTTRVMDIYVDNVLILPGWAFRSTTATNMDRVHLFSLSASEVMYDEIQIGQSGVVIDSFSVADPDCPGSSTGAVDLTAHTVNGSMTYAWSSGDTTEDLVGIPAGIYSVTVTDGIGCTGVDSVSVVDPAAIASNGVVSDLLCPSGSNGSIDLTTSGGNPGYGFSWSNGASTEDVSSLVAGSYSVSITDQNGCVVVDSFMVSEPQQFDPQAIATSPTCFGGVNGSIDLSPSGGTPGYSFSWSNGAVTEDINGLPAGDYVVSVTDGNACNYVDTVSVLPSAPIATNALVSDLACNGDQSGAIDLSPSGGTPIYVFAWNTGAVTEDLSNLVAGAYVVTITDVNSCVVVDTITVVEPAAIQVTSSVTNATTLPSNGAIDVTVAGGVPPFSFLWSNGATTEDLTNLNAGNYGLTVTDANGCTTQANYFVDLVQSVNVSELVGVSAYPNPFGDRIRVITGGTALKPVHVSVSDVHGRVIWSAVSASSDESIPTLDWPSGAYVLHAKSGTAFRSFVLMKP